MANSCVWNRILRFLKIHILIRSVGNLKEDVSLYSCQRRWREQRKYLKGLSHLKSREAKNPFRKRSKLLVTRKRKLQHKETSQRAVREEEEPIQKNKPKDREETKAAAPVYEEKPLTDKNKEEHLIQDERIRKRKPVSSMVSEDSFEKYKKNGMAW